MGQKLHNRIEIWKKLLLDFGKRNRLTLIPQHFDLTLFISS